MNKKSLALSISLMTALIACGGDNTSNVTVTDVNPNAGAVEQSRVNFQPAEGQLSIPNDLLFSGTNDGTLEMPDETSAKAAGQAVDFTNPAAALGTLDGWSPMMPMVLGVTTADGATIDAATVNGQTVRMIQTNCQLGGTGCTVFSPLTFGVDYVAIVSGSSIVVAPLKPLVSATTFIVGITNGVLDSRGEALAGSGLYEQVTRAVADVDLSGNATLGGLQAAINGYEGIVAAGTAGAVAADSLVYTASWTTTSVGSGQIGVLGNLAVVAPQITAVAHAAPVPVTVEDALIGAGVLPAAANGTTGLDAALLLSASVTLPYYSGTPDQVPASDPLANGWTALCDSGVALQIATATGAIAAATPGPNHVACQGVGLGDLGLDTDRHITRFNPVPAIRAMNTLAVQITIPADQVTFPGPWPIAMVQHGITSKKEDMLAITGALSQAGIATFAIDLPLHGSRGLASATAGGAVVSAGSDATVYMNLANLPVARDNVNQSIADMLGLRTAIKNGISGVFASTNFDLTNISFVGMSLGGITGVGFAETAQANGLPLSRVALSVPGGGIGPLLLDSASFGPLVQGSVVAGAGAPVSSEFLAFIAGNGGNCVASDLGCNYTGFTAGLDQSGLAQIQAILAQFAFAAQSIVDPADPNNFAAGLASRSAPIYMAEVVGDGINNLSDQVIPNQSSIGGLTFGGTEPLAAFLGLTGVDADNDPAVSGLVRFTAGDHGSLLSPSADAATTVEMQTQLSLFLSGAGINIVNAVPVLDLP